MTDSELAKQLSDLDWGAKTAGNAALTVVPKTDPTVVGSHDVAALDVDVSIPGVAPRTRLVSGPKPKRSHHKKKPVGDRHAVGDVVSQAEEVVRGRRPRDTQMDILVRRGESPAVMALFESMWREVGHSLALEVGRPKASKQDAALGWYMLLLAMRARDNRS